MNKKENKFMTKKHNRI